MALSKSGGREKYVSASEVGRAEFCPKTLEFKIKGVKTSQLSHKLRNRGDAGHDQLNLVAGQRPATTVDSRCYIASHLYGVDDPRTNALRRFRDVELMPSLLGRVLVRLYYCISPPLVFICRYVPALDLVIAPVISIVVKRAQRKESIL